mgnify:CR=1 FL=1
MKKYVERMKYVGTIEKYRIAPPPHLCFLLRACKNKTINLFYNVTFRGMSVALEKILSSLPTYRLL